LSQRRSKKTLRLRDEEEMMTQPIITFAELYERAQELALQRQQQRKVKLYFDSNDEYVMED